jgi:integrase
LRQRKRAACARGQGTRTSPPRYAPTAKRFDTGRINPTLKLTLPALRGSRDRVAAPTELGPLLDALESDDRAIYATALYAGLRLGELQALQWEDIDLDTT